jgi:hypothetical protein
MADMSDVSTIWVFNGAQSKFPSGVLSRRDLAENWIKTFRLRGTLTRYPVDISVYDWAIERNFFKPKKEEQRSAAFIGKFGAGSQEHYHYEDGQIQ